MPDRLALREVIGDVLRQRRRRQQMTLRQLSAAARVSLGYISEIERGQKEASSEMLSALAGALRVPLWVVLREVSDRLQVEEVRAARAAVDALPVLPVGSRGRGGSDIVAAA